MDRQIEIHYQSARGGYLTRYLHNPTVEAVTEAMRRLHRRHVLAQVKRGKRVIGRVEQDADNRWQWWVEGDLGDEGAL